MQGKSLKLKWREQKLQSATLSFYMKIKRNQHMGTFVTNLSVRHPCRFTALMGDIQVANMNLVHTLISVWVAAHYLQ